MAHTLADLEATSAGKSHWSADVQLATQNLSPAGGREEFELHLAALEWSLADPIIIERSEDIKSRVNWQDRLEPYRHQVQNLMTFCRRLPVTLIADDVGLGKTISAGLVLSELMVRRRVTRALVVCPSILGPQWIEELESKFGIFGRWATGGRLDDELRRESPVVATTYESLSPRLRKIQPGAFDMLILDEAHKLRNLYGGQKPPKLAQRLHKAFEQRLFKYVLMLTATPIQNRLWDLYTLVDCLVVAKGHANPFGDQRAFKRNFIADASAGARTLKPGKAAEFRRILRQYLVRTRRREVRLLFPKREVQLFRVRPNSVDKQLQQIIADNIRRVSGFMQVSLARALMSSPQALVAQLRNMAANKPEWSSVANEVDAIVSRSPERPSKVQGLFRIIEQLREQRQDSWRLVIFTIRRETQRVIGDALRDRGIDFGVIQGGSPTKNLATIKAFTSEPPKLNVVISTDAGAEGVNLQAGNVLINFDLPWNPMVVEQRIGRIQRLASNHRHVLVINLAVADSPEERVVARLMQKLQTIVDTVGDIEAILEASGADPDKSESTFEAQIRDMVLKSLAGQDVEKAARLAEDSVQEAKDLFERHQEEMDATLGDLNELHETGPSMPRLSPVLPSVGHEEFVQRTLTEEGHHVSPAEAGMLQAKKHGRPPELITFDEDQWRENSRPGVFMGKAPKLYLPGKPSFERLVQRWLDRGGHFVSDLRQQTEGRARDLFHHWLSRIDGAELTSVETVERHSMFQGRTRCKVTASNSLDSYEKLLDVEQVPDGHSIVFETAADALSVVPEELEPAAVVTDLKQNANRVIESDVDMIAFCKFYGARLDEELSKAGWDVACRKKVEGDLRPSIHAQAVALTGILYESGRFQVRFAIDGHDAYMLEFEACPVTGQLFVEPEQWSQCAETGRTVPVECLDLCEVSQDRVLRHLLVKSDESGRKALERYSIKCEVSGRVAFKDEFAKSDVSGRQAVASAFLVSAISRRRGLPEEFGTCDFTGTSVLRDELLTSDVSQRPFRHDEAATSAISGRRGHRSEFKECELTGDLILPSEGERSDLSGRFVRNDKTKRSTIPPYRRGVVDEFVTCAKSSKELLQDEAAICAVTRKIVDKTLLGASEVSGELALIEELVTCEVSGKKLLPGEVMTSRVSGKRVAPDVAYESPISGRCALPEECQKCQITGVLVLPDELVTSDVSGRRFRGDERVVSSESGRTGHQSEKTTCEFTNRILLVDEIDKSDLSGKRVTKNELQTSQRSGRRGHSSEMATCARSGKRLLLDEMEECAVTAQLVDKTLLDASEVSGKLALPDKLVTCEATGMKLLPDEVVTSAVSGKRIAQSVACTSPVSGRHALQEECEKCELSEALVLPDELLESDVSGARIRKDEVATSAESGRIGHHSEAETCDFTGRVLLVDEIGESDVSGKRASKRDLICSQKSGRVGHSSETVTCAVSGKQLLIDETENSEVSGLPADRDLLVASDISGALALERETVTCSVTGKTLLPKEASRCAASGEIVDKRLLQTSDLSGAWALPENMAICPVTGKRAIPQELTRCELSGELVAPEVVATCVVTGKTARRDKLVKSVVSGRWLTPSAAVRSMIGQQPMCPDEAVFCYWNEGYLLPGQAATCQRTGLTFRRELVSNSGEFAYLRQLLEGKLKMGDASDLVKWLRKQRDGSLKEVKRAWSVSSPRGGIRLVMAELSNWIGLNLRYAGIVVRVRPKPEIVGEVTCNSKSPPGWTKL